ncbi:MAG TPA: ABC transporter substrate-binding protein [Steroidobacteraceae bacterium]|nr:ABC transporter substrate-binding protein [Steroidobacteraceae bacterium]
MKFLTVAIGMLMLAAGVAGAEDANSSDPSQILNNAAQAMLKELDANRDAYRKDPSKIEALVEKDLLPHFDTEYAARLVLGAHWRAATPEQRQRFITAFYHSMIANYGRSLIDFTGDRLKVFPTKLGADPDRTTVRTEVKRDNGTTVPVNYSMRRGPDGWKAWDVVIDGISYVKSFREDFGEEIDQKGLDEVINRMEKGGKPASKS